MRKLAALSFAVLLSACASDASKNPLAGQKYSYDAESNTVITLNFDATEPRVSGKVVNGYFGPYAVNGKEIKFGPMGSTMMMGPAAKMKVEQSYFRFMEEVDQFDHTDDSLTLKAVSGKTMTFKKVK